MGDWVPSDGIDDAEEGEDTLPTFTGRTGTIYLIDAARYPNDPSKSIVEDKEQFRLCLECIEADLLKNILVNQRDLVSVVFYNTLKNPPPSGILTEGDDISTTITPDNCAVFIPLKPLSKDLIQNFKNFRQSDDFFDFTEKYGSSTESHFNDALWLCSRLIIRCNYKLIDSKILLFTNNEQPYMPGTVELNKALLSQTKDLYDNNITVDMVPMVDEFDFDAFYKEFLCMVTNTEQEQFRQIKPQDQRYQLLNRIYHTNYRKSCLRHLNFELSEGVALSCNIYSFSRSVRKPNAVKMFCDDASKVVIGKRSYIVQEESIPDPHAMDVDEPQAPFVARPVPPAEQFKSQNICGKEIIFKPGELVQMKSLQGPGLRLLGFKPLDQLRPRWMIKHCLFLYPSEKKILGSTKLFRALWEKCLEKEKYALCTLTMRRDLPPKYVALVPQTEEEHGNDGFCIIHLPMETNISVLDSVMTELPQPTPEQVMVFEQLCKKLRFKYQPDVFSNPMLQTFYKNLEALIYDEEATDVEDLTLPDYERQDPRIEPFLEQIEAEFGSEPVATSSRGKRGNDTDNGESRSKAPKKDLSMDDIAQALRNDRVEAVTVAHLKDFIKSKKAHPPTGTKNVLFQFAQKLID